MSKMVESTKVYVIHDERVEQSKYFRNKEDAYKDLALELIFIQAPEHKAENNNYIDRVLLRFSRWLQWLDYRSENEEVRKVSIDELLPTLCNDPTCIYCDENAETIYRLKNGIEYGNEYIKILQGIIQTHENDIQSLRKVVRTLRDERKRDDRV